MSIEELEEYLNDTFEMELLDKKKQTVQEVVESYKKGLEEPELKDSLESMKETMKLLEKYKDRYVFYATDYVSCIFGQGFVVVDQDNNYIGFVRTI